MTITNTSTLSVFTDPTNVPVAPPLTDPKAVDATSDLGIQVGGVDKTWTTTNVFGSGESSNVVLSGTNNYLNVGTGPANVTVLGGGNIVESVQFTGDNGKLFSVDYGISGQAAADASDVTKLVDLNAIVKGNSTSQNVTISEASAGIAPPATFNTYLHGGKGNDTLIGSFLDDFLRGGAGDDTIFAFGGNDLVRGGADNDYIDLGDGLDTILYTTDQVRSGDVDTLAAFVSGEDRLAFDTGIDSTLVFSGGDDITGYKSVTFTSGSNSTTLNIVSGAIKKSDITFLA